ncbi:unnamed protein product [Caenorhabditis bovis]|uniref:BPTI/Kunitz inhibitor domain-containing protein n=1 Tax=Caenorhabditis bovis TaxID=2654633 RepID=A0A8S1EDY8_9PELO|nr:unnamed protein product [Caenorhabditis bovis]
MHSRKRNAWSVVVIIAREHNTPGSRRGQQLAHGCIGSARPHSIEFLRMKVVLLLVLVAIVACDVKPTCKNGKNSDKLKCDKNGYFEKIQCKKSSCFCVSTHNGQMAYDTRTANNKIQPKCGKCLDEVEKIFSKGNPSMKTFVPKCDVILGDYEPLQCDANKDQCYCVDPKTGLAIKGTEKKLKGTEKMKCDGVEYTVDPVYFQTFPDVLRPGYEASHCLANRDPGTACSGKTSSIKYWFDKESYMCLPFEYKGCGGNANRFDSASDCYRQCVPMDYATCAMQSSPAMKSVDISFNCREPRLMGAMDANAPKEPKLPKLNAEGDCPAGYQCRNHGMVSNCCDIEITELYNKETNPKCPAGQSLFTEKRYGSDSALIGKSCSDNFCPKTHKCISGELFAYCCK